MEVQAVRSFMYIVENATENTGAERISDGFAINKISSLKMLAMSAIHYFIVVVVVVVIIIIIKFSQIYNRIGWNSV